ncbi:MAG: YcxB family protein [Myxococcales bacterium]
MPDGYVLEPQDIKEATPVIQELQRPASSPPAERHSNWRSLVLWVCLIVLFVGLYQYVQMAGPEARSTPVEEPKAAFGGAVHALLLAVAGLGVVVFVLGVALSRRAWKRPQTKWLPSLREDGLEIRAGGFTSLVGWSAIRRVEESPASILLEIEHSGWHVVPKRGFLPMPAAEVVRALRERTGQKAAGPVLLLPEQEHELRASFQMSAEEVDEASRGMTRRWWPWVSALRQTGTRAGTGLVVALVGAVASLAASLSLCLGGYGAMWAGLVVLDLLFAVFIAQGLTTPGMKPAEKEMHRSVRFEVAVDPAQFRIAWPGHRVCFDWSELAGALEGNSVFVLWTAFATYFVPKRSFGTQAELSRFRNLLRGKGG